MIETTVKPTELVGGHILDGVDRCNAPVNQWGDEWLDANAIRFRLDGAVFMAVEDPEDGYRSTMDRLVVTGEEIRNTFPPHKVVVSHRREGAAGSSDDVLEFHDDQTGDLVLEVGTSNLNGYYPSFVARWRPEGLAQNSEVAHDDK